MKTYLDCIPCFFRQALESARIAGADETAQKEILNQICRLTPGFSMDSCPAEMGRSIYKVVKKVTGKADPYMEIKKRSNRFALGLYPRLKDRIASSGDRLLSAVRLAIIGNVIDYGVKNSLNVRKEVKKSLAENFNTRGGFSSSMFNYREFRKRLAGAETILYLADNAGEVVFDRVLIEEIRSQFHRRKSQVVYAVRGSPAINDALIEDARFCGVDKIARIISSGSDAPGTILKFCSKRFTKIYKNANIVISKGQGNFEALSKEKGRSLFFLLKVKCSVIANSIGCEIGSIILKKVRERG